MKARRIECVGLVILPFVLAGLVLAGQAAAQGERTERFFEDWVVICVEQQGRKDCEMRQLHVTGQPQQNVFRWLIGRSSEGRFAGQWVNVLQAPLGVSLTEGIEVSPEGLDPFVVTFEICGTVWCQGRIPLSNQLVNRLNSGGSAGIHYRDGEGNSVRTVASGRGFGDALQYLFSQEG